MDNGHPPVGMDRGPEIRSADRASDSPAVGYSVSYRLSNSSRCIVEAKDRPAPLAPRNSQPVMQRRWPSPIAHRDERAGLTRLPWDFWRPFLAMAPDRRLHIPSRRPLAQITRLA